MAGRLLDLQVRLLEYLTSGDAIFRDKRNAVLDPSLAGIDRRLLDMEARFSHEKRMEKIAVVFPAAFKLLGDGKEAIVREFIDVCPPVDISRIENARQFQRYLFERWERERPVQPYLPDVVAFELACAQARVHVDRQSSPEKDLADAPRPGLRRSPGVVPLRAAFDIRPVFEGGDGATPIERETLLGIVPNSGEPQVFEITVEIFDLLTALGRWTPAVELPGAGDLIDDLAQAGMLELCR
jgi:hypothetical protein